LDTQNEKEMIEMKRIFAVGFLALALVACSHTEEADKGERIAFEQVTVVEDKETMSHEYEDYLKFSQEYSDKYHQMNTSLTEHFKNAEEKPNLMFDEDWIAELDKFGETAKGIYLVYFQENLNGDVPEVFKEVHDMTESAYKHKHLSIEEYAEGLRTEDKSRINKALIYAEASNQKMAKAVEMLEEVVKEIENK
jgi:hypothetical protein